MIFVEKITLWSGCSGTRTFYESGRNTQMEQKRKAGKGSAILCVLGAGLLWGCMGLMVRNMNRIGLGSMEIAFCRSVVTFAVMLAGMLVFRRKGLRIRIRDLWCFVGTGLLSVAFFNICYFSCMRYTSLSTAAILLYTAPAFVMVLSHFLFREKFTVQKCIALVLAFTGCVLVSGGFGAGSIGVMGILTGIGAGFGYALYSIFGRFAIQRGYDSYTITTYTFLFAALGTLPFVKLSYLYECFAADGCMLLFGIGIAIAVTVVPYLLYTKGLTGIENGKASIIASIEPVMATVIGVLVFREPMTVMGTMGMILVLASTVICSL